MADWKSNLINDAAGIQQMLRDTKTIAVLGIKPESHADQAAHYVPAHMAAAVGSRGAVLRSAAAEKLARFMHTHRSAADVPPPARRAP